MADVGLALLREASASLLLLWRLVLMHSPETTTDMKTVRNIAIPVVQFLLDVRFIVTSPFCEETSYVAYGGVVTESVSFSEASCVVAEYLASSVLL